MARPRTFRPEDIPIPPDAKPHKSWPPIMLEMAAHIGPYDTLRIVDSYAGQDVYIPIDARKNPFTEIIGSDKAAIISHVYGRQHVRIAVGRNALLRARRQGVIAEIRAGRLTVSEGAAILRMARRYLSHLVNCSDEGTEAQAFPILMRPRDSRQLEMFSEE